MKIVIDIDEKTMENLKTIYIKEGVTEEPINITEIVREVANGTPLPKGHGDLIDRDKFKRLMDEYFIDTSRLHYDDLTNAKHFNWGIENCFNEIDEMEPVIKADNEVNRYADSN